MTAHLPLFHLYGDPPDDQAFNFVHVETIVSRSSAHDWLIRAHRHRNLFQFLLIESGGGDMILEASTVRFGAPSAFVVPPGVAHGFRFHPQVTNGWIVSFTEDVAAAMGERPGDAAAQLKAMAADPCIHLENADEVRRLSELCSQLHREALLAREGYQLAMRAVLALIGVEVRRIATSPYRSDSATQSLADATLETLQRLLEDNFRQQRQIGFYANRLAMTADRLNDHVKRATGVTVGHLIRQRLVTEAKRELVFTGRAIHDIAYDLGFADPSHFARFFRKQTGTTPHDFRVGRKVCGAPDGIWP
jgi:AraC family transcriptional activator of pobA